MEARAAEEARRVTQEALAQVGRRPSAERPHADKHADTATGASAAVGGDGGDDGGSERADATPSEKPQAADSEVASNDNATDIKKELKRQTMLSPRLPRTSRQSSNTEAQSKIEQLLAEARRRRESRQAQAPTENAAKAHATGDFAPHQQQQYQKQLQGEGSASTAGSSSSSSPKKRSPVMARASSSATTAAAPTDDPASQRLASMLESARRKRQSVQNVGEESKRSTHTISMVKGAAGLGMVIEDAPSESTQYNIRVKSLREGGAAHAGGLQVGDRLILANGKNARSQTKKDMIAFFKQLPDNTSVKLVILRGAQ